MNNSALQRIANRAGVTRISNDVYDFLREIADKYLNSVVVYTIQPLRDNDKKSTIIKAEHVIQGITDMGFTYEKISKLPKCKNEKGLRSVEECAIFSKASIKAIIRRWTEMFNDWNNNYKWSQEALNNAQFSLETVLDQIIHSAYKITTNANRKTLLVQDLRVVLEILDDNCNKEI